MKATHKRLRSLVVVGGVMVLALAMNVAPASAHVLTGPSTPYNDGYGTFVATSAPNEHGCADYSNYTASLTFPNGSEATVSSTPLHVWGEYWDGTYADRTCPNKDADPNHGAGGDQIAGFTGRLTRAGANGGRVCTLSKGTYQRGHLGPLDVGGPSYNHPELNIMYVFRQGCGATDADPIVLKTTIVHVDHYGTPVPPFGSEYTAACNSPIAPQTCELGPQEQNSW
jgi:hypothetical protein